MKKRFIFDGRAHNLHLPLSAAVNDRMISRGRNSAGTHSLLTSTSGIVHAKMRALSLIVSPDVTFCHTAFVVFRYILRYSNTYSTICNATQFVLTENCSTCFGCYHHPISGAQTTVSTASGVCQTVTATSR